MKNELYLRTKSIHAPITREDGYRISVMSRHTLNDGITPDPLITDESFNEWKKELAPPDTLVGSYYRRNLPWVEFEKQYIDFLQKPEQRVNLENLISQLKTENTITLLCVEEHPDHCHRRLLAQECQKINPEIQLVIR